MTKTQEQQYKTDLQQLQEMAERVRNTEMPEITYGEIQEKISKFLGQTKKIYEDEKMPGEFHLRAAPGKYDAIREGMRHCFWFWMQKPMERGEKPADRIPSGAVYMGKDGVYISPLTHPDALRYLMEQGAWFSEFAACYFDKLFRKEGDPVRAFPEVSPFAWESDREAWRKKNPSPEPYSPPCARGLLEPGFLEKLRKNARSDNAEMGKSALKKILYHPMTLVCTFISMAVIGGALDGVDSFGIALLIAYGASYIGIAGIFFLVRVLSGDLKTDPPEKWEELLWLMHKGYMLMGDEVDLKCWESEVRRSSIGVMDGCMEELRQNGYTDTDIQCLRRGRISHRITQKYGMSISKTYERHWYEIRKWW